MFYCDYCHEKSNKTSITLPCGFLVCLDHIPNDAETLTCFICKDHQINVKECFNMPRNKLKLRDLETGCWFIPNSDINNNSYYINKPDNLIEMNDNETCCGFGGSFAVKYDTISVAMADQKIDNAIATNAEYIISTDMSCLMHLDGRINHNGQAIKVIHLADVLASGI